MSKRFRHHANPLTLRRLATGVSHVEPQTPAPIEVELGCADAEFIISRATKGEGTYYGVDIRQDLVEVVNQKIEAAQLTNIRILYANLLFDLKSLFLPSSIHKIFINFPDPYFKKSQHKRRFMSMALVQDLAQILISGGELFFQSDIFELALDAMDYLEADEHFRNQLEPWSFYINNPYGVQSRRESFVQSHGGRVWRLLFQRA